MRTIQSTYWVLALGLSLVACGKAPITGTYVGKEVVAASPNAMPSTNPDGSTASTSSESTVYVTVNEEADGTVSGTWLSHSLGSFRFTGSVKEDRIENVVLTQDAINANQQFGNTYGGYNNGGYNNGGYYGSTANCTYQGILFLEKDTLKGSLISNTMYCQGGQRNLEATRSGTK